jgi:hypothetical protein
MWLGCVCDSHSHYREQPKTLRCGMTYFCSVRCTISSFQTVFDLELSKDAANAAYGSHSDVHRHGIYLLFQIAMVDDGWC